MDEVYCGAPVDGGLCLRGELSAWGMGFHHDQKNGLSQPPDCHAGECHVFIPAYVRCPECDGKSVVTGEAGSYYAPEFGWIDCPRCATSPTPGFIPVSEEVRT